ncbi:MAG: glycosyltransferase [Acidobacteriota bacterium]
MHILYLSNGFPYPLTSGYLRHYFLIKELARRHTITLLSLATPTFRREHLAALRPFTRSVQVFRVPARRRAPLQKCLRRMRSLMGVDKSVGQMRQAVEELASRERFDLVFCGKYTFPAVQPVAELPLIADFCDATSMRIRRSMRYAGPPRLILLLLEYLSVRQRERRLLLRAQHSLFISARDREAVVGNHRNPTTIVHNGVDLDFWKRSAARLGDRTLVFTGAMDYRPNVDAAVCLIRKILPPLRTVLPDVRVIVVGRDPTPRLVELGRQPGVSVTGFVHDVRPYLNAATLFVAPLRFAAGMQNKLLEAMAMEVPIIASPLAAEGLRTERGQPAPIQVVRGWRSWVEEVAGRIIELSRDPRPDARARRFVERNFAWNQSGDKVNQVIETLLRCRNEGIDHDNCCAGRSRRGGQVHGRSAASA